jgi:XRE family transcriptional regulator, fatty acid utilization regulator
VSYFNGARLRQIRQSKRLTLNDVYERTGVSKAQISLIETGKADPRMSTVTRILSYYESSLSDLEPNPPTVLSISNIRQMADQASERLERVGIGASNPQDRLDRKAQVLEVDVRAERKALATRA